MKVKKMSAFLMAILLALAAAAAWFVPRGEAPPASAPADPALLHPGRMMLTSESSEVFRRAFWRRPAPEDKILHAERREWTEDANAGISRWQWFLAVEPGPGLVKWLREENAFGLHPAKKVETPLPPGWFPADTRAFTILASRNPGGLTLFFSPDNRTLYATAAGKGFAPGAPERPQSPAAAAPSSRGRLTATPPVTQVNRTDDVIIEPR